MLVFQQAASPGQAINPAPKIHRFDRHQRSHLMGDLDQPRPPRKVATITAVSRPRPGSRWIRILEASGEVISIVAPRDGTEADGPGDFADPVEPGEGITKPSCHP
jgi:hypothetical protein